MIYLKNVDYSYPKGKTVFKNLDLNIEGGHIYGLLGKNGAGKTTLLKILTGLLLNCNGASNVLGYEVTRRDYKMLQEIFYIQDEIELPNLSIKEYLKYFSPFYPTFVENDFYRILEIFEMDFKSRLKSLSLGQSKKFMIAFGLAANVKLLIMDEPTNGLDIPSKRSFQQLLTKNFDEERAIVISTHHIKEIDKLVDSIIIIDEGKILFKDDISEIESNYSVEVTSTIPDNEFLFSAKIPGGYSILRESQNQFNSEVDLELFFNAVLYSKTRLKSYKNGEIEYER